jgi:oxygen-independent coproporphyrinogen-3 oxidase
MKRRRPTWDANDELARRMRTPQRHRLLQGYPMAPLMRPIAPAQALDLEAFDDPARPVLIGVLPHPFCNPRVRGCGFCTFPHERFSRAAATAVAAAVEREVDALLERAPGLGERAVGAVYFGGGTANLTPVAAFARLAATVAGRFDLARAEVTLEGVPAYFLTHHGALLGELAAMPARHRRLSMGVQSFDPRQLERMGRLAFGDRALVERVVATAHRSAMTTSVDLVFNLPGQSVAQALADVDSASAAGFDQICVYNLVLHETSEWSADDALLRALPSQAARLDTWLALRTRLRERGYVQTTLTNFERAEVHASPRRFVYEAMSFQPERFDGLGFGPGAISCLTRGAAALKWQNAAGATPYTEAIATHGRAWSAQFAYAPIDLRLLHITRQLARLSLSLRAYERRFGTRLRDDFALPLAALVDRELLHDSGERLRLTPRGMFFADAVLGLFASERVRQLAPLRRLALANETTAHHMG